MNTNRVIVGFVAVLVMTCGLVLGGFASLAAAKTIVVTTLADTADPPFNADGPCGTGTVSDLPGADGLISLREAIIAANNTPGAHTITFAPSLRGGTIVVNFDDLDADTNPDPLPALCGGHTRIDGDLDGDGAPDITLEGAAFPFFSRAAGILIISSYNTIEGLQVQHFPFGIRVQAGDAINPGTVTHTTVTNNILVESTLDGIIMRTGDAPGSLLTHTTITQNLVLRNGLSNRRFGIFVVANLSGTGSDTHIAHTTITDNKVRENGNTGILTLVLGDHNRITDLTIARNTASANVAQGINVMGGFGGADGNTVEVRIRDNTVADNGLEGVPGLRVVAGQDNSSNNHVVAQVHGNIVEQNQVGGILIAGGEGAANFLTGTSVNNEVDVRLEHNTVKNQNGFGIVIHAGVGRFDGRPGAVADNNHIRAIIKQNVVEDSTDRGIELAAGGAGFASTNTLDVRVEHNTVCHNIGTDIHGEGGFSGSFFFVPNQGTGNVLAGRISQNTATTVTVADGTPRNTATVTQFNNDPCP